MREEEQAEEKYKFRSNFEPDALLSSIKDLEALKYYIHLQNALMDEFIDRTNRRISKFYEEFCEYNERDYNYKDKYDKLISSIANKQYDHQTRIDKLEYCYDQWLESKKKNAEMTTGKPLS